MRNLQRTSAFLLILVLLLSSGCAGRLANDRAVWPAVENAWPSVRVDAVRGEMPTSQVAQVDDAVAQRRALELKAIWPATAEYALRGIEARDTSEPIEALLVERVRKMQEAIDLLR